MSVVQKFHDHVQFRDCFCFFISSKIIGLKSTWCSFSYGHLMVWFSSFNLKPSTLSTFSMLNGRLFYLDIVAGEKKSMIIPQYSTSESLWALGVLNLL